MVPQTEMKYLHRRSNLVGGKNKEKQYELSESMSGQSPGASAHKSLVAGQVEKAIEQHFSFINSRVQQQQVMVINHQLYLRWC